jgi:hypothetical protein|tara:strand:+ start:1317 stop:1550 length:234 start_codon:yes stop_codon:yes gene_type:complete
MSDDAPDAKIIINAIVDLMIQGDSIREEISELKKQLKASHDIPVATITKVATIIRKSILEQEQEKWDEILELVEQCS